MDQMLFMLINILFYSIPSYLLFIAFSLLFWGFSVKKLMKPIIWFIVIESIYVNLFLHIFELPFYFINSIISYFLLFFILFKALSLGYRFIVSTFAFVLGVLSEVLTGILIMPVVGRETLLSVPFLNTLIYLPVFITMSLICWIIVKKNAAPGKRIVQEMKNNKQFIYLSIFLFVQFIMVILLIGTVLENRAYSGSVHLEVTLALLILISLVVLFWTIRVIQLTRHKAIKMTQKAYIEDIHNMFTTIRGQRHDFLNHVQMISAYLHRGKDKELKEYVAELVGETEYMNEICQIGNPVFAALVQSKMVLAENKRIKFKYSFTGIDSLAVGVKSIDIVKIVGNLLDNAFDEVEKLKEADRWVEIKGWADQRDLHITVMNPGSHIPEAIKKRIYDAGYSTKATDNHAGIGLSIVKDRIDHYNGAIDIESSPEAGTVFKVKIPMALSYS